MAPLNSNKKVGNTLVGISFAAVLAVYSAGYARTRAAAEQFEVQAERRPSASRPSPAVAAVEARVVAGEKAVVGPARTAPVAVNQTSRGADGVTAVSVVAPVESAPALAPVEVAVVAPVAAVQPAPTPTPAAPASPAPPAKPKWKDGAYTGWGTSRHGDIEAEVVIQAGKILNARISQCLTRYSCDVIDRLVPQVAQRQSPDVDYVSGATQSADAFYWAVTQALGKAEEAAK